MADLNKWIGMGRLTADPELKATPSGVNVTSFTVACNRIPDKNGGTTADFISVVAWRKTAEFIARYFRKGQQICIEGKIQTRSYTDQRGDKRYVTEVVADTAYFAGNKQDSPNSQFAPAAPSFGESTVPQFEEIAGDDDLPF